MMPITAALGLLNYGLVLVYGTVLSVSFTGGCASRGQEKMVAGMCLLILLAQTSCFFLFGFEITKKFYPLIAHLPLVVLLSVLFKRPLGVAVTGVMTGYFCCQLPRWFGTVFLFLFQSKLGYQLGYLLSLPPFFFLLHRYLAQALYQAMLYSKRTLLLFAFLPVSYYLFDYATTVYSAVLYEGIRMLSEFLPTVTALFYVIFLTVYHSEMQKMNQLTLDNIMLSSQSQQAQNEIRSLHQTQQQAVTYRHDLRHHVSLLQGFLNAGQTEKAQEYLAQVQAGVDSITPRHFCENETADLIFSSYAQRAEQQGLSLSVRAELPQPLDIPDAELCAVLSNGLENALHAAAGVEDEALCRISVDCRVERSMVLVEMENAYAGPVQMQDGLPVAAESGHGYGCRSIRSIAEKHSGFCVFKAANGIFTLRVVLPLKKGAVSTQETVSAAKNEP